MELCPGGGKGKKPAVHNLFRGKLMATFITRDGNPVTYQSYRQAINGLLDMGYAIVKDGIHASNHYSTKPRENMIQGNNRVTVLFNDGDGFIRG